MEISGEAIEGAYECELRLGVGAERTLNPFEAAMEGLEKLDRSAVPAWVRPTVYAILVTSASALLVTLKAIS